MATLFPKDFNIKEIENASERHVVDLLINRLGHEWIVSPNFKFHDGKRDREIDVIVLNPIYGVGIIEVKGGQISIKNGRWIHNGDKESPEKQAHDNSFALRDYLQNVMPEKSFKIGWGICLPKSSSYTGELPGEVKRNQFILSPDLEDLEWNVERIIESTNSQYALSVQQIQIILDSLYPEVHFQYDPDAELRRNRERLNAICEAQVEAVMSLEVHHRVMVVGAAGTGKTYLATRWAMSGLISEDETPKRVLLTCYNDPLGLQFNKDFSSDFCDDDEQSIIYAGPFMKTLKLLPGMPEPEFENTNNNDYWENALPEFLKNNLTKVEVRFDRIIVDEAQDFSPAWIQLLESLLDPDGDNQLFLLFDQKQQLNNRGFEEPSIEDGWVRAELRTNVRNSFEIARLARQFLNGAAAPTSLPSSSGISLYEVVADSEIAEQVKKAIGLALNDGFATDQIIVIASGASLRDELRRELLLGVAEERFDGRIPCETAHRAKGLEADCVIIAVTTKGIGDSELYVAVTRAISRLTIIGPCELMQRIS